MGIDILYHVRGSGPIKGVRTLRFRNRFQGLSCLIASPDKNHATRDWFSRYITGHYPYIQKLNWDERGNLIGISINGMSNEPKWNVDKSTILKTGLYIYKYYLDDKWNKHPFKDCYMTRGSVRYSNDVKFLTLESLMNSKNLTIDFTE